MGEPTCLVRSLSAPADTSSCVTQQQEMNPMRMLGESISFGRFMSEGLDWERWSAFSHNRYVEEAEKYSKPGSVAAKKAYFEAHYKRKAKEKEAALIQEANARANEIFDSKIQEGNCTNSTVEMESIADSIVAANEQPDKDAVNYQVVDDDDTNQYKCDAGPDDLDISNVEGEEDVAVTCVDTNLNVENCVLVDNSNKEIAISVEERIPDPGTAGQEVLGLPVKGGEVNSSPKLSAKTRPAKLSHSLDERKAAAAVPPGSGVKSGSRGKKSDRNSVEKKIVTARSLHMSINLPSSTGATSKTAAAALQSRCGIECVSKSKKPVGGSMKGPTARSLYMSINLPSGTSETSKTATAAVKPTNGINRASKSMKSVGASVEKRPTARSLHMSINLPSGDGGTSKTAWLFEHNRSKKIHSNLPSITKHHPLASQTSTEASDGFSNQASANPPSQGRSCLKSSSTTKSNPRSHTIPSPFRFRSEERAVKYKEFLQRMDEIKSKEEEKVQLQRMPKEKIEHDHKKLPQSNGSKSKLHEDRHRHGGSQSPSNQIRKDKIFGYSWKPPISTNNTKRVTEKFSRTTTQSLTSLPKITRENASPNIHH